ncbi:hypothetical protein ScPMuIL_015609 [Solemya velum]
MNSASVVVFGLMILTARCQMPGLGAMPELGEMAMLSNMMGTGTGSGGNSMFELAALSSMMGGEGMGAMMPGGGSNNLATMAMFSSMMENQKPNPTNPTLAQPAGNGSGAMPMPSVPRGVGGAPGAPGAPGSMPSVAGMPPMTPGAGAGAAQQPPMSMMSMMNSPQSAINSLTPNSKTLDMMREGLGVSPVVSKMLCPPKQCPFPLPCENPKTLYSASTFYVCPECPKCPAQIMQNLMREASQKLTGMGVPAAMRGIMSQRVATKNMEQLLPV